MILTFVLLIIIGDVDGLLVPLIVVIVLALVVVLLLVLLVLRMQRTVKYVIF